jgi:F-type H+-transporting ATPase subunit a
MQVAKYQTNRVNGMFRFFFILSLFMTSLMSFGQHNPEENGVEATTEEQHADSHGEEGTFNAGETIMHHVMDAHEIHLGPLHIPLPIILYDSEKGLVGPFSSSHLSHGEAYNGYIMEHEHIYNVDASGKKIVESTAEDGTETFQHPLDVSMTKTVVGMFLAIIIMLLMFTSVSRAYKKRENQAPKGLQSALEPLILFVRDEIAKPSIGKKYEKFLPYLLTIFFFIWISNMLGLIPFIGGFNITGNLTVALVLALFTFVITSVNGNKDYWKHIYNTPGVPWWLKFPIPLMFIIEFIGFISKPVVLTLRLFANITAGHIIILAFVSLIFIFKDIFGAGAGYGVSVLSVAFSIFMFAIELLVAFLQAYVFTLLSAIYFGSAVEEHAHH